jgi:putative transposase
MGAGRGRLITEHDKQETIILIKEASEAGCRVQPACELLGIDIRTLQRWSKGNNLKDKRHGPITAPPNKLTDKERAYILEVANSPEYYNQAPSQIVPKLADKNIYIASEKTFYRVLKQNKMLQHRSAAKPKTHKKPDELSATQANQLWSWDITYLLSDIRGKYFYLYLFLDVFSRKIVGFDVHDVQSAKLASSSISKAYINENVSKNQITLHSDNGKPMKGNMMLATLQSLGIAPSFSRPSVSDDNPFSEALFKTLKYCPQYPTTPFTSTEEALAWVVKFVDWYNNFHQHSGINFVTPSERHQEKDQNILDNRIQVYELAKNKNPNRWSGKVRTWSRVNKVYLNAKRKSPNAA